MTKEQLQKILYFVVIIACVLIYFYNPKTDKPEEKKENPNNNYLEVQFIDVGQADCILIMDNGHNMLIDAGNNKDGKLLVDYFKSLNIVSFDYVVGTHPHEDHIGGLDNVIKNFEINNILMPDVTTNLKTFEDVLNAIEKKKYQVTIPTIGDKFKLGDSEIEIIYTGTNNEDLNSSSIVIRLDYYNNSYLFTADATSESEKIMLDKNIDVDVLKVAHHGSVYSNSAEFLEKVTPEYAVIEVGANNDYYYPHIKAINRLKKYTDKIYQTSELGTIIFKDNGTDIEISNISTNTDGD